MYPPPPSYIPERSDPTLHIAHCTLLTAHCSLLTDYNRSFVIFKSEDSSGEGEGLGAGGAGYGELAFRDGGDNGGVVREDSVFTVRRVKDE